MNTHQRATSLEPIILTRDRTFFSMMPLQSRNISQSKGREVRWSKKLGHQTSTVNQKSIDSLPSITKSMNSNLTPEYKSHAMSSKSLENSPSIGKKSSNDTESDGRKKN